MAAEEAREEEPALSKKKKKMLSRMSVAELKSVVATRRADARERRVLVLSFRSL